MSHYGQLTFTDCQKLLSRCRKSEKRLQGRNTVLYKKDEHTFCVRYHNTDVVEIHNDGSYTLNSGGYETLTTKARINEYSPARISQMKFVWYLCGQEFKNGCRVDGNGHLIDNLQEYHFKNGYKEPLDYEEIELNNGGCLEWDNGTIRYIDCDGNTENIWNPGDEDYETYKSQYFPSYLVTTTDD